MLAQRIVRLVNSLTVGAGILLIHTYRLALRPLLVGSCKFHPTCSEYAEQALRAHGPWHGTILALRRLLRCHPFTAGGLDPVPEADARAGN
jgi:putative membrane protein insertion efficiency factor